MILELFIYDIFLIFSLIYICFMQLLNSVLIDFLLNIGYIYFFLSIKLLYLNDAIFVNV